MPTWAEILQGLTETSETVATAESLTGGRLATRLSDVPGSSEAYLGGVVSYATGVKIDVLGVPDDIVEEHGVVSAECARAMADGVRRLTGATYAVSTTGVAGPAEQEGKPVGTVYVGLAGPSGVDALALDLTGDRPTIQEATVDHAVSALGAMIGSAGRDPEEPARV